MDQTSSLMDLHQSFPVRYEIELDFSKENLQQIIEEVASFVSKVYATFPSLSEKGREQLRHAGVDFNTKRESPSKSECKEFESALKNKIISHLSKEENKYLCLSTDYVPEKMLCKIAKTFFRSIRQIGFLFPYKTTTIIELKDNRICLNIDFTNHSCNIEKSILKGEYSS